MRSDAALIGLDGGATEVKAHAVACDDLARPTSFELRPEAASRAYSSVEGFTPVPVAEQLGQRERGEVLITDVERAQGRRWVQAAAEAIADVARQLGARRVLVGAGLPGLKTPDGRGIDLINNGPRIPDYLRQLETRLSDVGVELASRIATLGSDADYCGLGEQYASDGRFRDVDNAYYVGCGTGIADALKLRGELVPFDQADSWILKSWQMRSALGPTFEQLVSAASLNRIYADFGTATRRGSDPSTQLGAGSATEADDKVDAKPGINTQSPFPELAAVRGEPVAVAWLETATLVLAELIFERLWTIRSGRAAAPHRGDAYARLDREHAHRGTLLDRVVIGQRLGQIYADPRFRPVFAEKLERDLAALIAASPDDKMRAAYLLDRGEADAAGVLRAQFVVASRLRAAPALGAAVAAVRALGRV